MSNTVKKSGELMKPGSVLLCRGEAKTVTKWQADWSLALSSGIPHVLWVLWEGETKYEKFTSDLTGGFTELSIPE